MPFSYSLSLTSCFNFKYRKIHGLKNPLSKYYKSTSTRLYLWRDLSYTFEYQRLQGVVDDNGVRRQQKADDHPDVDVHGSEHGNNSVQNCHLAKIALTHPIGKSIDISSAGEADAARSGITTMNAQGTAGGVEAWGQIKPQIITPGFR